MRKNYHLYSSLGEKPTTLTISMDDNQNISLHYSPKDKAPDFQKVWDALLDFILELGKKVPKQPPKEMSTIKSCVGDKYVRVNDHSIGRLSNGEFSLRGDDSIPLEDLRVLLYPLKEYLDEEKT